MLLFAESTTTQASGFDPLMIVMLLVLAVLIFFMFRNNKKRKQQAAELQEQMVPGVEVMTNYGLYGELREIDEEHNVAYLEIAPGQIVKVHRQTLARVVPVEEPVIKTGDDGDDQKPASSI